MVSLTFTSIYKYTFLCFLFFNCIFYREFSYVSLGGVYITEMYLVISAVFFSLIIFLRREILLEEKAIYGFFFLFGLPFYLFKIVVHRWSLRPESMQQLYILSSS